MGPELVLQTLVSLLNILGQIIGQEKAQAVLSVEAAVRANALADIEELLKFGPPKSDSSNTPDPVVS